MNEELNDIIHSIAQGDTTVVERFLRLPGGRKYLENITLILINTLPHHYSAKEEMYRGFVEVLNRMEGRIRRQQEGQVLLQQVFANNPADDDK